MTDRRVSFDYDGHRFEAVEREHDAATPGLAERQVAWVVSMDGNEVLEFHGEYPYRDADVRKRVLEWYGIQKPPR